LVDQPEIIRFAGRGRNEQVFFFGDFQIIRFCAANLLRRMPLNQ
jgi:hypothetical protein